MNEFDIFRSRLIVMDSDLDNILEKARELRLSSTLEGIVNAQCGVKSALVEVLRADLARRASSAPAEC